MLKEGGGVPWPGQGCRVLGDNPNPPQGNRVMPGCCFPAAREASVLLPCRISGLPNPR